MPNSQSKPSYEKRQPVRLPDGRVVGMSSTWVMSLLLATYLRAVCGMYLVTVNFRGRRLQRRKTFGKALVEGLRMGAIADINDVVDIYRGVAELGSEDLTYRYGLSRDLRTILVELIQKGGDLNVAGEETSTIVSWKNKISDFIKTNEAESPYADLPSAERNCLADISSFIEIGNKEELSRKTLEVAAMIQARSDDFKRVRRINYFSIPLAVVGVLATIAFGILSAIK